MGNREGGTCSVGKFLTISGVFCDTPRDATHRRTSAAQSPATRKDVNRHRVSAMNNSIHPALCGTARETAVSSPAIAESAARHPVATLESGHWSNRATSSSTLCTCLIQASRNAAN
jgi:hypothetical protein